MELTWNLKQFHIFYEQNGTNKKETMDNYLEGIIKEIKQHKNRPKENIEKTIIKKIENICQEHLDNTEINNISLCEDSHDHYLLGKVDMAQEILKEINN
jgi:hypothetical protein